MNKKLKRILLFVVILSFCTVTVKANPKFSPTEATDLWNDLGGIGLKNWIFAIIPGVTILATGAEFLSWNTKDSEEKEQKPFSKVIKRNVIFTIAVMSIAAILRIFGLMG